MEIHEGDLCRPKPHCNRTIVCWAGVEQEKSKGLMIS